MRILISRVGNNVGNIVENSNIPFVFIVRESLGGNQARINNLGYTLRKIQNLPVGKTVGPSI